VYIIVGLGNPGPEYQMTRHNAGYLALDLFAKQKKLTFKKGRGPYYISTFKLEKNSVVLVKPTTFMNLSGVAVREVIQYYKVEDLSKILIVLDDINLPFGTIRIRPSGSDGGQKGLRSVINLLGTQNIPRLRIGIGNNFSDAVKYVLSPFSKSEKEDLDIVLQWTVEAIESFIINGIDFTMSRFNKHVLNN